MQIAKTSRLIAFTLFLLLGWTLIHRTAADIITGDICAEDTFTHLRTGQWISEQGNVPRTDPFSTYGEKRPIVVYSWLYELTLYTLSRFLDLSLGILFFRLALALLTIWAMYRMIRGSATHPFVPSIVLPISTIALAPLFVERPWLTSVLFFALTLTTVHKFQNDPRTRLWPLPLLFAFWGNIHIQFIYGLLILAALLSANFIEQFVYGKSILDRKDSKRLFFTLVGCSLSVMLNPYGYDVYATIWDYAGQFTQLGNLIREFKAPDFRTLSDWMMLVLVAGGWFALGRERRPRIFDLLLMGGATFLALKASRDRWSVVLVSIPIISRALNRALQKFPASFSKIRFEFAVVGLALVMGTIYSTREKKIVGNGLGIAASYPWEAVNFLESKNLKGNIFGPMEWGGLFMWKLPQMKVVFDGRTNVHGGQRTLQAINFMEGFKNWQSDPDFQSADIVVWLKGYPLAQSLRNSASFTSLYEDDLHIVFQRIDESPNRSEPSLSRHDSMGLHNG